MEETSEISVNFYNTTRRRNPLDQTRKTANEVTNPMKHNSS